MASPETNRKLLKLADLMETVPDEQFNMGHWVRTTVRGILRAGIPDAPGTCGTTACAAGWATTIPEFKRAGLALKTGGLRILEPNYNGFSGFRALEAFFDITYNDSQYLFGAKNITAKEYARRLRQYVRTGEF